MGLRVQIHSINIVSRSSCVGPFTSKISSTWIFLIASPHQTKNCNVPVTRKPVGPDNMPRTDPAWGQHRTQLHCLLSHDGSRQACGFTGDTTLLSYSPRQSPSPSTPSSWTFAMSTRTADTDIAAYLVACHRTQEQFTDICPRTWSPAMEHKTANRYMPVYLVACYRTQNS
jgi:hypothetical protein